MVENPPVLSVVIPMFNEEDVLPLLVARLRPVLDGLGEPYEVVAVDDGSGDTTAAQLLGARRHWPSCGWSGCAATPATRPRSPPASTAPAATTWPASTPTCRTRRRSCPRCSRSPAGENLDIVYGVRSDRRSDSATKRGTAGLYYWLMRRLVGVQVPAHAGDFRLLSRATVDVLRQLPEHQPVYRLLVPWIGFPSGGVSYVRESRAAGRTKYPLRKMLRLAADSVTNFSAAPLRIATWLGAISFFFCLLMLGYVVVAFSLGYTVQGWASVLATVLFLGAVQLLCLGLLGEYLGRLYASAQGRPAYFVGYDSAEDAEA